MKFHMNRNLKTPVILVALVAMALLVVFWATARKRPYPLPEDFEWRRWNLSDEQRREIAQLSEDMRKGGATRREIMDAVTAMIDEWGIRPPIAGDIELFYTAKTVVSSVNTALLVFLLFTYYDIYRQTRSEFTIGLIIFALVLLLYALSSNPLVHWIFGFRAFGLGPFAMLPDLFTLAALVTLLYLTLK